MLYGRCRLVDTAGRDLGVVGQPFDMRRMLLGEDMIRSPAPSSDVRPEEAGPLDESLSYGMDYDFFIRVARSAPPVFVDRELAAFTVHERARQPGPGDRTTRGIPSGIAIRDKVHTAALVSARPQSRVYQDSLSVSSPSRPSAAPAVLDS